MHPFALSKAEDLARAVAAHAMDGQLAFIAGGTDLLGLMKDRAAHPERLLDINGLPALPLLAFGFLAPNADLLWRKLRSEDAWGSLRSERGEAG